LYRYTAMINVQGKRHKLLSRITLYVTVFVLTSSICCSHNRVAVEEPNVPKPRSTRTPSVTALEQTIERLEVAVSERDDQLATLRQRLERVTEQRDAYVRELEQTRQERDKFKQENEVLNKKLEEILAPKPVTPAAKPAIYVVQEGDTLESIAGKEDIYGDRSRWKEIYEENKDVIGSAPDKLEPGTKLIIPRP